ncbi:phytoene desaturase family protein [Psychromicrobium sp. YIM B11713]|uniref:phytoene desaturase family protein n=1 Tax=Psychromicrobium sp. YIM B11713 TaxID=3145233 RepID=UPI00374FDBAE
MTDAAVVGSGPNGLAAAVILARAGLEVDLYEARESVGGGTRTEELIEPGHWHDVCSAVHPMAMASPFFREFGIAERIDWLVPELSYGHPLDGGRAALAYRDLDRTVDSLGVDGAIYRRLMEPLIRTTEQVVATALNPLLGVPRGAAGAISLGLRALWQGGPWWNVGFKGELAPALISGAAAHPVGSLPSLASSAAGLVLAHLAHTGGWPIPRGGSARIADALLEDFVAHGGRVHRGHRIRDLAELSGAKIVMADTSPRALDAIAGNRFPARYSAALQRFRYNNAACKVDFILSEPVPWQNQQLRSSGTLHVAGTRAEMAHAEAQVARGEHPEKPYVLVSQPSLFDPDRAPAGRQVLWTYCHVPAGSTRDMTEAVVSQIERFAPGFRDVVLHSKAITAAQLAEYNVNYIGGDFGSGATNLRQLIARPVLSGAPWRTPLRGLYLCSSSSTPGPGVHGMSGMHAARLALKDIFGTDLPDLAPPPRSDIG